MNGDGLYAVTYPYPGGQTRVIIASPHHYFKHSNSMTDFCRQYGLCLLPGKAIRLIRSH